MAARAEGADGDSLSLQVRGLPHLGMNPELIGENVDQPRENRQVRPRSDGARCGADAGGGQLGLARDQGLRGHRAAPGEHGGNIEAMLPEQALIFSQPDARMRGYQSRMGDQEFLWRLLGLCRLCQNCARQKHQTQTFLLILSWIK